MPIPTAKPTARPRAKSSAKPGAKPGARADTASAFKRLTLDIRSENTDSAHRALLRLLRRERLLSSKFLYRGTDEQELRILTGEARSAPRHLDEIADDEYQVPQNSIDCYSVSEMRAMVRAAATDLRSPVAYARDTLSPVIAVYKADELEYADQRSRFEYRFKHPKNRIAALAVAISLMT